MAQNSERWFGRMLLLSFQVFTDCRKYRIMVTGNSSYRLRCCFLKASPGYDTCKFHLSTVISFHKEGLGSFHWTWKKKNNHLCNYWLRELIALHIRAAKKHHRQNLLLKQFPIRPMHYFYLKAELEIILLTWTNMIWGNPVVFTGFELASWKYHPNGDQ